MNDKIAIIFTTFLRNGLAMDTIASILGNWRDDYVLLVADQNRPGAYLFEKPDDKINYYQLPFDCGLSYARNFLVQKAKEMGCEFCLVTADSIAFEKQLDLDPIKNFLRRCDNRGLVGFNLEGRAKWEWNFGGLDAHNFILTVPKEQIVGVNINYVKVDLCKNFYLAKTEMLVEIPWDNDLKVAEHEDWAWRVKQNGKYLLFSTGYITAKYIDSKSPEYLVYRQRMYNEFRNKLRAKYKIDGWVQIIK